MQIRTVPRILCEVFKDLYVFKVGISCSVRPHPPSQCRLMNVLFNTTKIIGLILLQDCSWLYWDSNHSLRFKLKIPVTCLKYQVAVIVHICIDGLAVISLGWYAGYVVWEILTPHPTLSLPVSPPVLLFWFSLPLSSLICSSRLICHL